MDPRQDPRAAPDAVHTEPRGGPAAGPLDPWPDRDAVAGDPSASSLTYRLIVRWTQWVVRGHYRVEVRGAEVDRDAPTLLVQNHTNGLVDAHFLMVATVRPIRVLVKYKLLTTPFIGWILRKTQAVPMYRKKDGVDTRQNAKSFEAIDRALAVDRAVIALFPEGESLDAVGLRMLRTGVGRMAVSAEPGGERAIGLRVVPLGVSYERRDRPRTAASLLVGEPIHVAEVLARGEGGGDREGVTRLMARIEDGMRALVLDARDEEEWEAAAALARILPSAGPPLGLRRKAALESLRADVAEGADRRRAALTELGGRLERHRLEGDDVLAPTPALGPLVAGMAALVPALVVVGLVMGPSFLLGRAVSRFRKTPDKLVTLRLLFTFAGTLLWPPALVALVGWAAGPWAAAGVAALAILAIGGFPRVLDSWLGLRAALARRALDARGETEGLRGAITRIRAAHGPAPG